MSSFVTGSFVDRSFGGPGFNSTSPAITRSPIKHNFIDNDMWQFSNGMCSATCGTSFRTRTVSCVVTGTITPVDGTNCVAAGLTLPTSVELCTVSACPVYAFDVGTWKLLNARELTTDTLVDDSLCLNINLIRPTAQEECIVPDCVVFTVGEWGTCSATCGTSVRTRTVTCVAVGTDVVVDQAQCLSAGLTIPSAVENCVVPDCYTYSISAWGECSATCGSSFRTRTVTCVVSGTTTVVDDSNCVASGLTAPTAVEVCAVGDCPIYVFESTEWSECSATCGNSIRVRTVTCREHLFDVVVDDSFCFAENLVKPTAQEQCIVPDCVQFTVGEWGECSATCGTSVRTRTVTCVAVGTNVVVDQAQCESALLTIPSAVENCVVPDCYTYSIGAWGECSATCGTSFRIRTVSCVVSGTTDPVDSSNCAAAGLTLPTSVELCTVPACPVYAFDVSSWSECSATCGSSVRVRTVECREQTTDTLVDDSLCLNINLIRPTAQEECVVPDCVVFTVGEWGECSATCGTSTRTRAVTCVLLGTDTVVDQIQCLSAGLIAPSAVESCVVPDCYVYSIGAWGECTATCDTSFRIRTVSCVVVGSTVPVDNANCVAAGLVIPTQVELCTVPACPVYSFEVGAWSECSATCGISIRARTVECRELTSDTLVDDTFCLERNLVRPTSQEECVVPDCVEFTITAWGECSATCGTSVRTRTVTCVVLGTDTVVDEVQCTAAGIVAPTSVEDCVVPDCHSYNVGVWGECSATCGTSFRTRTVSCVVTGTNEPVDNNNCLVAGLTLPSSVELCTVPACPVYGFEVGTWSECSATCGVSIRARTVECFEQTTGTLVDDSFCLERNLVRPDAQENCLVPDCVEFTVGPWGECSATCGTSSRTRAVTCVILGTDTVVDQSQCTSAGLVAPISVESCVVPDCYTFTVGEWGECSATCGTSFRTRSVSCTITGTTTVVDSGNCVASGLTQPIQVELCTVPVCPVYGFEVGAWSECSATCGTSFRARTVECREQTTNTVVDDSFCTERNLLRPSDQEECIVPDCVQFIVGEYGECSATCGVSTRTRSVTCVIAGTNTVVDQTQCLAAGLGLPTSVETCVVPECFSYSISEWGECSATCGTSFRTRTVSCVVLGTNEPVDNGNCVGLGLVSPPAVELCTVPACPVYNFNVGSWSSCSATCGTSIRARTVECVEQTTNTVVDDSFCLERNLLRPAAQEDCVVPDCVEFTVGAWGECSATCGTSTRTRTVTCVILGTDTVVDQAQCAAAGLAAPTAVESCVVPDCYVYDISAWGECSATCGTSFRTRVVSCVVTGTSVPVDTSNCAAAGLTAPTGVELCTVPVCPVYTFEVGSWSACSATCGVSIRARTVECLEQTTNTVVDDSFCLERNLVRPAAQEDCIVPDCVEFTIGPWGECSATCGTSTRTRTVTCVILGTDTVVDQAQCLSAGLTVPAAVESCVVPDCHTYSVGEWGECSATCGTSFRIRTVSCVVTGTVVPVDNGNCVTAGLTLPSSVELCTVPACPVYSFEVGGWSECSATCGVSIRARTVECREQTTNTLVDDSFCLERNLVRPAAQEDCLVPDCVQFTVGAWGECSATCGTSTRTRTITCVILGTDTVVDQAQCAAAGLAAPAAVESCVVPDCYIYNIGGWGECSATCGTSFRTRAVSCVVTGTTEPVDNSNCVAAGLVQPVNVELCTVPACPVYSFNVGGWSECSATCGVSIRARTVECVEQTTNTVVDDSFCLERNLVRPAAQEDCIVPDCVAFTVGPWGECSATCGTSTRTRSVTCVILGTDTVVDQAQCAAAGLAAPAAVESCAVPDCFIYNIGAWGECSATCGTSFRTRTVSCVVVGTSEPVDNGNCAAAGLTAAPSVELCTVPACPVYSFNVGTWSSCSATCGVSIRARTVECVEQTTNTVVDDSFCLERNLVRPVAQEECVVPDCVEFTVGAWGECSATCGTSTRTRVVSCVILGTDTVVDQAQCTSAGLIAPLSVEACLVPDCYTFTVGQWGECSATCGTSFRTRTVSCVVTGTTDPVDNSNCLVAGLTLPSSVELCTVPVCPVYGFEVGTWSECSATCGSSIRVRTVECREQTTDTLVDDSFCLQLNLVRPTAQEECVVPQCVEYTVGAWGECSATCGTSTRTRSVTCVILGTDTVVDQAQCVAAGLVVPAAVESCVVPDCVAYNVGAWGECSATCGTSFRTRTVTCVVAGTTTPVDNGNCLSAGLTTPSSVELCTVPVCPVYEFNVGSWSSCSATCGTSIRVRTVQCLELTTNTVVDDSFCLQLNLVRPADQEECLVPLCVGFIVSEWGQCSATCGSSFRSRTVTCVDQASGNVVSDTLCTNAGLIPVETVEICVVPVCNEYFVGAWGECSATCGTSVRVRDVYCVNVGTNVQVDESLCVIDGLIRPADSEVCVVPDCIIPVFSYTVGEFGVCDCDTRIRIREVNCIRIYGTSVTPATDAECIAYGLTTPTTTEACVPLNCPAYWYTSEWSECSVTCGCGVHNRIVQCRTDKDDPLSVVDEARCAEIARPIAQEECHTVECPEGFGCGSVYRTQEGQLTSPLYLSSNYPRDIDCVTTIEVQSGFHIAITVIDMDIEFDDNCEFDYLKITDTATNLSETHCGPLAETHEYTSVGNTVTLEFVTDSSIEGRGYALTWSAVPN
ncbi:ADAMTS-like protein 1 [Ptychodera flava]|uniref:ADAMTS-like protein 1 n=1 Tax=Ptychodera flava TaxID=63121 RepID=UPI003969E981